MTEIRPERPSDHDRVCAIYEAAFGRPNEARLVTSLRRSARPRISLVAEIDSEVVGHVFFSPVTIAPPAAELAVAGFASLTLVLDLQKNNW